MKKFNMLEILIVIVMFLMVGCTTGQNQLQIKIDPESQAAIGKITGRHTGNELAKEYPDIANEVMSACNDILAENNPDIIVTLVKNTITALVDSQIKDPLLKADIQDIIDMVKVKSGVEVTAEQLSVIKAVAEGLISGVQIYQHQNIIIRVP